MVENLLKNTQNKDIKYNVRVINKKDKGSCFK